METSTGGIRLDVVYRPGVKHQVPDALSRIEITGGESGPFDNSIPCPEYLPAEDANCDPVQVLRIEDENWDLAACHSGECLSLVDSHLRAEPISKEEWIVEQSYDSLCQTVRTNAERTPSSGFSDQRRWTSRTESYSGRQTSNSRPEESPRSNSFSEP